MAIYHEVAQRSAAWHILRLGKPTASSFDKIVTPKTAKLSASATPYMHRLLAEQMLGRVIEEKSYQSEWMERGDRLEEEARKAYSALKEVEVAQTGFVTVDSGRYGASPDGLVGTEGGFEMKIPAPHTHMGYLLKPDLLTEGYGPQLQGGMLICEREWWDILSYHPEMPPVIVRVKRNEEFIKVLRDSLDSFCDVMSDMRVKLERDYKPFPEPQIFEAGGRCSACGRQYETKDIGMQCSNCESLIISQADVEAANFVKEW